MRVKIRVRTVGQAFGCEASLVVNGQDVYTTRVYPYGMESLAYSAAAEEASQRGYTVDDPD